MVLVDGMVGGAWKLNRRSWRGHRDVQLFRPIPATARAAVTTEAHALLAFAAPDVGHDVTGQTSASRSLRNEPADQERLSGSWRRTASLRSRSTTGCRTGCGCTRTDCAAAGNEASNRESRLLAATAGRDDRGDEQRRRDHGDRPPRPWRRLHERVDPATATSPVAVRQHAVRQPGDVRPRPAPPGAVLGRRACGRRPPSRSPRRPSARRRARRPARTAAAAGSSPRRDAARAGAGGDGAARARSRGTAPPDARPVAGCAAAPGRSRCAGGRPPTAYACGWSSSTKTSVSPLAEAAC